MRVVFYYEKLKKFKNHLECYKQYYDVLNSLIVCGDDFVQYNQIVLPFVPSSVEI